MLTYRRGQVLYSGSSLVIVDAGGDAESTDMMATPLGQGATGVVLRAVENQLMPRAVKILTPTASAQLDAAMIASTFLTERKNLALLTHSHLAKLINFGTIPSDTLVIPYLVMDYVEGTHLHTFIAEHLDAAQDNACDIVVELLADVLGALSYVHRRNAMHGDVKEKNIVVRQIGSRPEAILVDLGCAHIFDNSRDHTFFYSTRGRHDEEWDDRIGQSVDAALLHKERVHIDLHMFGVMLALLMNRRAVTPRPYPWQERTSAQIEQALGQMAVIEHVAEKCMQHRYEDAIDAANDLRRLLSGYASPLGVPELSIGSDAQTSIALPETRVVLTPRLRTITNHPCLQRLRDITQLDLLRLVYPGASHTRLLHSYETYEIARQYVGTLLGHADFRAHAADKASVQAVLLGALLHDIGHYPLEHVFEDLAYKHEVALPYAGVLTDDQVARAIFLGTHPQITSIVTHFIAEAAGVLRKRVLSVPELITAQFGQGTFTRLVELLNVNERSDPGLRIMSSILDGPLDADKVAYLRTDSVMTGARFGHALDIDSLLGSLTCVASNVHATIAITEKGISAAEAIATARRWMFQRVYWHRTNRAIMAMLRYPIQYAFEHGTLTFDDYLSNVFELSDVEAVRFLHTRFDLAAREEDVVNPALALIAGRRGIYKRFLEFASEAPDEKQHQIHDFLFHRTCSEWRAIAARIARQLRAFIPDIKDSDVLLDVPVRDRPQLGEILVVDARNPRLEPQRLSAISDAYKSTKGFFIKASMLPRVFVHPEVLRKIAGGGRNRTEEARSAATELLYELAAGKTAGGT